jgi:divalent metal cation (Fe/Co/Zn/Cd) transporter
MAYENVSAINDIKVSLSGSKHIIRLELEDGHQIWMSIETAQKLCGALDDKLKEAYNK